MAKRGRPLKKDEPKAAETPAVTGALTKPSLLKSLFALKRSTIKQTQALAGTLGERVANAIENQKLHRKAFNMTAQLDKLEPEQLADFFPNFDYYCDVLKLRERAASAPRMELEDDGSDEGTTDEAEPARRTADVKPFPSPRADAAE